MILWIQKQSVHQLCSGTSFYLLFLDISQKIYVVIISEKPFNITDFHKIQTALHLLTGIQRQILSTSTASLAVTTTYSECHLKSLWNTSTTSAYARQKFSTPNVRTLQWKRCNLLWFLFFTQCRQAGTSESFLSYMDILPHLTSAIELPFSLYYLWRKPGQLAYVYFSGQ